MIKLPNMKILDKIPAEIADNSAFNNILTRVSVRRYTDETITDGQLTAILHAAMSAPSGVNKQPWEFIVVDDRALLTRLADALPYAKMAAQAPLAIVVCGNKERMLPGVDANLWEQDCSAASENILLAAHALGLGGVWTCLYPHTDRMDATRRILNIGDGIVPFNLIPIGHAVAEHAPMAKWHIDRVHFNGFNG